MNSFFNILLYLIVTNIFFIQQVKCNDELNKVNNIMMQKHILQVDGGGVRGAYASAVLNKIHDILQEHNMGQISDFFKGGMSGTSTGSFIVLGLAAKYHKCRNNEQETREAKQIAGSDFTEGPYTPLEILQFYHKKSRFIFDRKSCCYNVFCNSEKCCDTETTHCFSICSCSIPHWLNVLFTCNRYCHNCNGYCGPKYDNTALKKSLVDQFGNMTLKDVIVPVQIVAYNLGSNSPVYFTSQTHPDVKMVDAALASAAAPTYFEAITMDHPSGFSTYVDGGLVDNSSALASIRFCIENFDRNNKQNLGKTSVLLTEKTEKDLVMSDFSEEYLRKTLSENNSNIRMVDSAGIVGKILTLEKIVLVSVGTGEVTQATRTEKLKTAGKIGWLSDILNISMIGASQASHYNIQQLYKNNSINNYFRSYYRFQTSINIIDSEMDDSTKTHLMAEYGNNVTNSDEFNNLKQYIVSLSQSKFNWGDNENYF